jgi:ubiquinone biosynthesis accessory factor UbiK
VQPGNNASAAAILPLGLIHHFARTFHMLDPKHLDDLAQRLAGSLPKGLQALQSDINRNLRAGVEAGLARLDLVTREEFDVQTAVLRRTREKLAALEARVAQLERQMGGHGAASAGAPGT